MEFGIGFVLGGVPAGVTVANWSSVVKAIQLLAAKARGNRRNVHKTQVEGYRWRTCRGRSRRAMRVTL